MTGYVYRVVVTRWPDWCPDGWERVYSDVDRYPPFGPDFEGDPTPDVPDGLRTIADSGALPSDFPSHRHTEPVYPDDERETDRWQVIMCPRRDRAHWLSGSAAFRWVRHARALGAEAHVERASFGEWEVRP